MKKKPISLLITGTSHVGKTTLAASLSETLGCKTYHTDKMGRHPGRPWPKVRPFIADFYASLRPETLLKLLLIHHQNMWPSIERLIQSLASAEAFIFEGCALRPEYIHAYLGPFVKGVCLTADPDFISNRIRTASGYESLDEAHRMVVDGFINRSVLDDKEQVLRAHEFGVPCIRVDESGVLDQFRSNFLADTGSTKLS
ncbi:MAG: hypothetical protein AAGL99_11740 [Pseudomonadota bacterium]